jgi:hypothetical protein
MSESPVTSGPVLAISDADDVTDLPPEVAQRVF